MEAVMKIIARVHTDFPQKFGIPRQSGLVPVLGKIVFEPEYRNPEALRGIENFSHLWLIWQFSENLREGWSPTVRPPRLGGNKRVGVFATRSSFRPNSIGLSSVELVKIEYDENDGPVIVIKGADIMDNTPLFDIKPYLPYTDSHPNASAGFAKDVFNYSLKVNIPTHVIEKVEYDKREMLFNILANDPRPSYHDDKDRIYGMSFSGMDILFRVDGENLTVEDIITKQF